MEYGFFLQDTINNPYTNSVYKLKTSRIENKWPVAKEGIPFIIAGITLTGIFFYFELLIFWIILGIFSLFTIYFFRDPKRTPPSDVNAILSPADGTIIQIKEISDNQNPLREPTVKISIFMSVLNVHVNRIPINGVIDQIAYHPGRFFSANLDKASEQNERCEIILSTTDSKKIAVVQIAGLIARRIACWINMGDDVQSGQRFGLIRFGSRLDVFLPQGSRITAQLRQKTCAGETILGYFS